MAEAEPQLGVASHERELSGQSEGLRSILEPSSSFLSHSSGGLAGEAEVIRWGLAQGWFVELLAADPSDVS